jgi:hypothetical protein
MLMCEGAISFSVTDYTLFGRGRKFKVIAMTRRAVQGSHGVINLMLHQAEISQTVIEL